MRVAAEVARHERLVADCEDALERARGGLAERVVDRLRVGRFFSRRAVRSTSETFGVGTRIAMPSSLPAIAGSTSLSAFAAPVVVGIIDSAAARARRRSLCGRSRICWSFVYEWIVVMMPLTIPNVSCSTFATGARQFVVHDAFEMMWCFAGLYVSRLMPMHERDVGLLRGRADDHLLRAACEVLAAAGLVDEPAGRLDHDVDAEVLPRDLRRVLLRDSTLNSSPST